MKKILIAALFFYSGCNVGTPPAPIQSPDLQADASIKPIPVQGHFPSPGLSISPPASPIPSPTPSQVAPGVTAVKSKAEFVLAMSQAKPGDTVQVTNDITFDPDTALAAGIILDFMGHTMTFNHPSDPARGFMLKSGITVKNGTILNADWSLYSFLPVQNITVLNMVANNTKAAIKLAGDGTAGTANILIDGYTVQAAANAWTIFDFGPGQTDTMTLRNIKSTMSPNYENTGSDGIAFEHVIGPVSLTNIEVNGSAGDGVDIKNYGDVSLTNVLVRNITRNGVKIWGPNATHSTLKNVRALTTGLEALILVNGTFSIEDSQFYSVTAANFGGANKNLSGTVKNTKFGKADNAGYGGLLLSNDAYVTFDGCTVYNPNHASVLQVGYDSTYTGQKMTYLVNTDAIAGKWPANWTNSTYTKWTPAELQ